MSKYEIEDAYKLKVFMQEIQTIVDKYEKRNMYMIEDCPQHLKEAIEWIAEMVKQKV
jgi:hypothetical protein